MTEKSSFFPKNVFGAFGILFFISGGIIPIQNLIIWGPEIVIRYFTSLDITAEKLSLVIIGIGVFMVIYGKKKENHFKA
jgi:membrane-bound ClpP family serine protease